MPWRLSPVSAAAHFFHRGETLLTKVACFFFFPFNSIQQGPQRCKHFKAEVLDFDKDAHWLFMMMMMR